MAESNTPGSNRSEDKKKKRSSRSPRNTLLYIGSVIILILVVVTFVGVPAAGSFTQTSGSIVFGRYNGEEIAYRPGTFFARQYQAIAQTLRDSDDDLDLELQLRIAWRQAFNRTVLRTAILQQADRSDMRVTEARVDELIAQDPRFSQNGRFDAAAYRNMGNQEQFALRSFHRDTEKFDRFVEDILSGSVVADGESRFVADMSGPERSFDIVRFPFDGFPEDQVRAYAGDNPALFTELNLSVITLGTRDEADNIRSQARDETSPFGELARTYSRDLYADQSGDIGSIWGHELQQELINPEDLMRIVALDAGTISEPVETTSGWSFYRIEEPPRPFADDDAALAEVRDYMRMFEQGRIQDFVRDQATAFAESFRATDRSQVELAALAAEQGRQVRETPYFPINYGNVQLFTQLNMPDIPELRDAAQRQDFFISAFSLEDGEISDPIVLRQSAVVLRLRDERQVDPEDSAFIVEFYESILGQFQSDEIQATYLIEDRLEDNFLAAFNRYVLGNR